MFSLTKLCLCSIYSLNELPQTHPQSQSQSQSIKRSQAKPNSSIFGVQISFSGYINQSLEVDEYFPLLSHQDDFDYRTDVFDDEESEDELQFSDDYDVDAEQEVSGDDDDEEAIYDDDFAQDDGIQEDASGNEQSPDVGQLILRVRRESATKNQVVLALGPRWSSNSQT